LTAYSPASDKEGLEQMLRVALLPLRKNEPPRSVMSDLEILPRDVKQRLDRGEKLLLIDVREPYEHAICQIEGAVLIPMGTVPANLQKLDIDDDVVCFCHHGMRSMDVANWLRAQGVKSAKSMAGGIDRWSVEIDPQVPRY
jgi:rhodanese-related sulfurtransferase